MLRSLTVMTIAFFAAGAAAAPALADRTLVHEAVVAAPLADVWHAFTTSEGFRSWAVAHAEIDLRIGGDMRTHYDPKGALGDENTIVNRIISFEPQRMLSIRNVQAPKGFKNAHLFQQTWSVISFEPLSPDRTLVRCTGLGYGEGPEWDEIYGKFNAGNAYVMAQLQKKFAPGVMADDPQRVMLLLGKLAGGEWVHESAPPGAPEGTIFRVRNVIERGPDGRSLIARGWLGDASAMHDHSASSIWLEPADASGSPAEVRFHSISETGAIARGAIRLIGSDSVEWDWNETAPDGRVTAYRVTMSFLAGDRYAMRLDAIADDGSTTRLVEAEFTRIGKAAETRATEASGQDQRDH